MEALSCARAPVVKAITMAKTTKQKANILGEDFVEKTPILGRMRVVG
jgi:hypothetical protein